MATAEPNEPISEYLEQMARGDKDAIGRLLPHIYDDLRAIARNMSRSHGRDNTLQATALVHEAYARLVRKDSPDYDGRSHFMKVAAQAMRQLLTDYARTRRRLKRGGEAAQEELHDSIVIGGEGETTLDLIDLDDALREFSEKYPRHAKVVELRFFTGLSVEEAAQALDITPRRAKADWELARKWLSRAVDERR